MPGAIPASSSLNNRFDQNYSRDNPSTGDVYFVGKHIATSADSENYGRQPDNPFRTIDYAIGRCTANNGDVIYVLPGHAEAIGIANGIDLDVGGVKIIGLGQGTGRPTITLDTVVGASIRINADNVWLENVLILGGIDNITTSLSINGRVDVTLKNIEYRDSTGQCAIFLAASNNSDRLTIDGLRYIGDSAAGTTRALQLDGCDDFTLRNFAIYGNFSTSAINFVTTLSARVRIIDGQIWTENSADLCILDTITGSTGICGPNLFLVLEDNAANITEAITGATFYVMDPVYVVNAVNEKAMLINWTASTDA